VAVVKPGRIMFEIAGVNEERATEALRRAAMKMPMKCKVVVKTVPGTDFVAGTGPEIIHDYVEEDVVEETTDEVTEEVETPEDAA
jgi:hypothetical protein